METKSKDKNYSLEFVVDENKAFHVEANQAKICQLFNVIVDLKDTSSVGQGEPKQWIHVKGPAEEASLAKEYIIALTSPRETTKVKNVLGHPALTHSKLDEIERTSGAVLSTCDNTDLAISGTEFSVMLAQSMVDDVFSKDIKGTANARSWGTENGTQSYAAEGNIRDRNECILKEINTDKGNAGLNRNNSSHTPLMSQVPAASAWPEASYYDRNTMPGMLSREAQRLRTSGLARSDFNHNCVSTTGMPTQRNEKVSEQGTVAVTELPTSVQSSHSMFASASAISPLNTQGQCIRPARPSFITQQRVTEDVSHPVSHKGDGLPLGSYQYFPTDKQQQKDDRLEWCSETEMETCYANLTPSQKCQSETSKDVSQQAYLRHLGLSLHYSEEDIEKGLGFYNMDDIVRPADFIHTLKEIKAQRHGEGLYERFINQRPVSDRSATFSGASTTAEPVAATAQAMNTGEDITDFDESVICMGSVSDDVSAIVISSDDEEETPQPAARAEAQIVDARPEVYSQPQAAPGVCRDPVSRAASGTAPQRRVRANNLRYIIIDGSNVAMAHGNDRVFSVRGLEICIKYFVERGHDRITAFVPEWRRYSGYQTASGRESLNKLSDDGFVKFTPARRVNGTTIASYDDRYILNLAEKEDGIVVSNDQFRDLCQERRSYQKIVAERLLQFMFVEDHFMPPDDPLGRYGPSLDEFLRYPQPGMQPHGNDGNKAPLLPSILGETGVKKTRKKQVKAHGSLMPPLRSSAETQKLLEKLTQMFPDPTQKACILKVLKNHQRETDINKLTNYCMNALFK